jgi:methylthioribulose-1-phosphate dehydratase
MSSAAFRSSAARTMCEDARAFYEFGWLLGTSGNLSVRRDPDSFLISASGKDKGRLGEGDFLLCDMAGHPIEETSLRPSAETLVHCVIYRRFADAGAVYHVHEPYAALCSARDMERGATLFRDLEMIKGFDIWEENAAVEAPIVANHFEIPRLADAIDELLAAGMGRLPGVTIHNHGIYAWGKTAFEAKRHVETFAYLYRYSWEWGTR